MIHYRSSLTIDITILYAAHIKSDSGPHKENQAERPP